MLTERKREGLVVCADAVARGANGCGGGTSDACGEVSGGRGSRKSDCLIKDHGRRCVGGVAQDLD